jgi:hypothetical protein
MKVTTVELTPVVADANNGALQVRVLKSVNLHRGPVKEARYVLTGEPV